MVSLYLWISGYSVEKFFINKRQEIWKTSTHKNGFGILFIGLFNASVSRA